MPELSGFVNLYRRLLRWEWHAHPNTLSVFIHLLLLASFRDTEWHGQKILRGQAIIGRKQLAQECGISEREVRTAIEHLKTTGDIATRSTNRFTVVTLVNYGKYQPNPRNSDQQNDQQSATQSTSQTPTSDHIVKILEKNKNSKRERGGTAPALTFDPPGVDEVRSYMLERGYPDEAERFFSTYARQGWRLTNGLLMTDWRAAVDSWQGLPAQQAERAMSDDEWLYR